MTVIAFNHTLRSSLRVLSIDSPLAYTGLVPAIAVLVAFTRPAGPPSRSDERDRRDAWLGIALCALAVATSVAGSSGVGSAAWAWRVDVPAMAVFVAGAILLLLGRDELGRQRATIVLLALAWPMPWALLFLRVLTPFTAMTVAIVRGGLALTHWATPAAGSSTSFLVKGRVPYVINVASACSGIDGVIGFVLVSVAFGALVVGSRIRKALWLVSALVLLWMLNAIRVLAIFGVAQEWGRRVAIDWLHPYAGIALFNIALIAMLALLGRFGLGIHAPDPGAAAAQPARLNAFVCSALAAVALVGCVANARLEHFDLAPDPSRVETQAFAQIATRTLGADHVRPSGEHTNASAFFADNASWLRYDLTIAGGTAHADVIRSDSRSALATFGTAAFVRSPATAITRVELVSIGGSRAQVWHLANGTVDVAWIRRLKTGSLVSNEQIVLSGRDRRTLLSLATPLVGAL